MCLLALSDLEVDRCFSGTFNLLYVLRLVCLDQDLRQDERWETPWDCKLVGRYGKTFPHPPSPGTEGYGEASRENEKEKDISPAFESTEDVYFVKTNLHFVIVICVCSL